LFMISRRSHVYENVKYDLQRWFGFSDTADACAALKGDCRECVVDVADGGLGTMEKLAVVGDRAWGFLCDAFLRECTAKLVSSSRVLDLARQVWLEGRLGLLQEEVGLAQFAVRGLRSAEGRKAAKPFRVLIGLAVQSWYCKAPPHWLPALAVEVATSGVSDCPVGFEELLRDLRRHFGGEITVDSRVLSCLQNRGSYGIEGDRLLYAALVKVARSKEVKDMDACMDRLRRPNFLTFIAASLLSLHWALAQLPGGEARRSAASDAECSQLACGLVAAVGRQHIDDFAKSVFDVWERFTAAMETDVQLGAQPSPTCGVMEFRDAVPRLPRPSEIQTSVWSLQRAKTRIGIFLRNMDDSFRPPSMRAAPPADDDASLAGETAVDGSDWSVADVQEVPLEAPPITSAFNPGRRFFGSPSVDEVLNDPDLDSDCLQSQPPQPTPRSNQHGMFGERPFEGLDCFSHDPWGSAFSHVPAVLGVDHSGQPRSTSRSRFGSQPIFLPPPVLDHSSESGPATSISGRPVLQCKSVVLPPPSLEQRW